MAYTNICPMAYTNICPSMIKKMRFFFFKIDGKTLSIQLNRHKDQRQKNVALSCQEHLQAELILSFFYVDGKTFKTAGKKEHGCIYQRGQ